MRIQSAMLCESASILSGKLYVLGAGLAVSAVPELPATLALVLAGVIEADPDLDVGEAQFTISVVGGDEELVHGELNVQITGPDIPGVPWVVPLVAPLEIAIRQPGPLDVVIGNEAGIDVRIPLMVVVAS